MLSRLIAAATAGALLMLDAGAPALAGPDPTYPTARFTLNKTTTYMYTPHPGDDPVGRGSFQVTTSDVADDETPSDDIQIEVTTGEGSEVYPWPAYCRTMACGLDYGTPGTFHPTMRLTDGDGHVTTIELPALTVLRDKIAPVARLRMPAPRQRHRVSAWRVIRGSAADAGIDGTHSQLWVLQKRRGFWRYYDGYTRVWHKGLRTEAATWTRLGPRINPVDNAKVGGNRWRTPWIRGLTRGPLVVRLFAADQNSNEFGPRKVAWIRLTRR